MAQHQLTEEQIRDIRETFDVFDLDGNGTISPDEIEEALQCVLQSPPDPEMIKGIMADFDKNQNGTMEFGEFLQFVQCLPCRSLREAFRRLDKDNDGSIDFNELKQVMVTELERPCTDDDLRQLMQEVDKDGDGRISYKEFLTMFRKAGPSRKGKPSKS